MDFLGTFTLGAIIGLCLFFITLATGPRYAPIKRGEWLSIIGAHVLAAVVCVVFFGLGTVFLFWMWSRL